MPRAVTQLEDASPFNKRKNGIHPVVPAANRNGRGDQVVHEGGRLADPAARRPFYVEAQRILAEEAARREAAFQQSVQAEKTRGDALSKRFEEALRQAREEPIGPPPKRDFDLD